MCVITIPCNNKKYACAQLYFSVVLFHNITVRYDWILCVFLLHYECIEFKSKKQ